MERQLQYYLPWSVDPYFPYGHARGQDTTLDASTYMLTIILSNHHTHFPSYHSSQLLHLYPIWALTTPWPSSPGQTST